VSISTFPSQRRGSRHCLELRSRPSLFITVVYKHLAVRRLLSRPAGRGTATSRDQIDRNCTCFLLVFCKRST